MTGENTDTALPTKNRIPLNKLIEDHATQVRGGINSTRVADYAFIVAEQGDMEPIDVWREDGADTDALYWIGDGYYRIAAYRASGKDKIPATIHIGTKSDAIEFGLRKNGHHGAPMSAKEKRAASGVAVNDPKIGNYSDARIAKLIGVSTSLVNQVRRGVSPEDVAERGRRSKGIKIPGVETPVIDAAQEPAPQSGGETDAAPPSPAIPARPPKEAVLRQIQAWVRSDMITVADVAKLIGDEDGQYVYLPHPNSGMTLRVVGVTGRVQVEVPISIKSITYEEVCLRYTAGKLVDSSPEVK